MFSKFNFPFAMILDIIIVGLFILFACRGKRRGLIKTVAGILVLILAFFGAGILADSTTPAISKTIVEPQITNMLTPKVESLNETTPRSFEKMLVDMGVPRDLAHNITESSPISEMLLNASKTLGEKLTYAVLCLLYFIVLLLALNLIVRLIDGIFKIPVLSFVNQLGGLLCGLIFGYLFIMIVGNILKSTGFIINNDTLMQTRILKYILLTNPLILLSGGFK